MPTIVVTVSDPEKVQPLINLLENRAEVITVALSRDEISNIHQSKTVDALIGEDSEIDFLKEIIIRHPMTNFAVVSSLPAETFHDITEGYGIFMQLSPAPTDQEVELFFKTLENIRQSTQLAAQGGQP